MNPCTSCATIERHLEIMFSGKTGFTIELEILDARFDLF